LKRNKIALAGIALLVAGGLALAGCSSSGSGSPSASGGDSTAIIKTNGSEPENPLIPTNTNEVGGGKILDEIFAGLVYYDAKGAPQNDMAESITVDDAQNLTVKLKKGQKFTDGTEVKAHNFIEAWNYGAKLSNAQLNSYFFEDIEGFSYDADSDLTGLKEVDDYTFTIALNKPASDFALRLGYSAFYPLPDSAFEDMDAFGQNPIGNGPYKIASADAWEHNVQISLVKNDDYQGGRAAHNAGLDIVFYATQDAAYADLLSGEVDVIDGVPSSALATFESELGDRAVNQPAAVFQSFTIPSRLAHFSGEEGQLRRQAISMSINREEITKVVFNGTRTPASDFTSPVIDGWSDKLEGATCSRTTLTRRRSCGLRPTPSRRGRVRSRSRTTPTAATRRGSTRCELDQEHAGHRRVRRSVRRLRVAAQGGHGSHDPDRVPHRLAGGLPGSVQLPRPAVRDQRRLERR
jgi:oligopeptide transport system substrate-binding protein